MRLWPASRFILLAAAAINCKAQAPSVNVLTGQYNNSRTGANLNETILSPSTVSPGTFGLLFTQSVDGMLCGQPLYVQGLTIGGAIHNVVFVGTSNDSVYAFDADTEQPALWQASLGPAVRRKEMKVGILSTPAIDPSAGLLFAVALTEKAGVYTFWLHALNLLTGNETAKVAILAAVPGTGDNSQAAPCTGGNGASVAPPCIPFVAGEQLQRPALLLDTANQVAYLGFGTLSGQEFTTPYHGWLMGYSYAGGTLTQTMAFNATENATQTGPACSGDNPGTNQCGHGGGIWMSGRGAALDSTGIYLVSGNGGYGGPGTDNWGESALRLNSAGTVADSFTPNNYKHLNQHDLDLSDSGVILFSSTNKVSNLMLVGGKTGFVFVLNRAKLGGFNKQNSGAVQVFTGSQPCGTGPGQGGCYEIHNPALWAPANASPILYIWGYGDILRVWDFNGETNQFTPDANQGTLTASGYPGGGLAVSSNGSSGGIVWGIVAITKTQPGQGALYAFDAANVQNQLWVSSDYWFSTKFTIPSIANGKVYVPTSGSPTSVSPRYSPQLRVYGLLPLPR